MRVFVYGTLLAGESNHALLADNSLLGQWSLPPRFSLYDVGHCPVLCMQGSQSVSGEVYAIDGADLKRLDQLEGYPHHYDRALITSPWGPAWYYFMRRPPARSRLIPAADWRRRAEWPAGDPR
jgi:gamma-glutamylaminecyclotransferase